MPMPTANPDRASRTRTRTRTRPRSPRAWLAPLLIGSALVAACSSDGTVAVPSAPTLQAAATGAAGAASTVVAGAPTVATSAAQLGGTAAAGAGSVATSAANAGGTAVAAATSAANAGGTMVTAAGLAATSAANAAATARAAASPLATLVATQASGPRATADARTPLNSMGASTTPAGTGMASDTRLAHSDAAGGVSARRVVIGTSFARAGSAGAPSTRTPPASTPAPTGTDARALDGASVRIAGVGLVAGHPAVTLQNPTDAAVDVKGWRLRVDGATVVLPSALLGPRDRLTLHLADGGSRGADVYLGRESADLLLGLQPGARMQLIDGVGRTVSEATAPTL